MAFSDWFIGARTVNAWLDDTFNPITVREIRQAAQSSILGSALMIVLLIFLAGSAAWGTVYLDDENDQLNSLHGGGTFVSQFVILLYSTHLVLPLYMAGRLVNERNQLEADLLFLTTLSPRAIVSGKMQTAAILGFVVYGAAAPFLIFTYMLRGIDLTTIFVALGLAFLSLLTSVQVMVTIACVGTGLLRALLFMLGFIFAVSNCSWLVFLVGDNLMLRSSSTLSGPILDVQNICAYIFYFVSILSLGYIIGMAMLMPASANRALPIRGFLTFLWFLTGLGLCIAAIHQSEPQYALLWAAFSILGIILPCMFFGTLEPETLSARVAVTIPHSLSLRTLAFFYYPGGTRAFAWGISHLAVTLLIAAVAYFYSENINLLPIHVAGASNSNNLFADLQSDLAPFVLGIILIAVVYTGQLFRRWLMPGDHFAKLAITFIFGILLFFFCLPTIFYLINMDEWDRLPSQFGTPDPWIYFLSLPAIFSRDSLNLARLVAGLGWLAICIRFTLSFWYWQAWRTFQPSTAPPAPVEAPIRESA